MAQPLEQKKRQKILVGILVAVVIITVVMLYSSYYKGPSVEETVAPGQLTTGSSAMEEELKTIKLDFSIFDDDLFKSLKSHGVLPVTAGEAGGTNPFEQL